MFTKFFNCVICAGLISLSTANIAQADSYRFYPNRNPGIHRTLIIPNQGFYNTVPQRASSYDDNRYDVSPIYPSQEIIIIINSDRLPKNNRNYGQKSYPRRYYDRNQGYSSPYYNSPY